MKTNQSKQFQTYQVIVRNALLFHVIVLFRIILLIRVSEKTNILGFLVMYVLSLMIKRRMDGMFNMLNRFSLGS